MHSRNRNKSLLKKYVLTEGFWLYFSIERGGTSHIPGIETRAFSMYVLTEGFWLYFSIERGGTSHPCLRIA